MRGPSSPVNWLFGALLVALASLEEAAAQSEQLPSTSAFEIVAGSGSGFDTFAVPNSVLADIARTSEPVDSSTWFDVYSATASTDVRLKAGKGWMFRGRTSTEQLQGIDIIRRLAETGNTDAAVTMGMTYERGFLVPQDPSTAFRFYLEAANGGDPLGQLALGRAYAQGIGVKKDYTQSFKWIESAYKSGEKSSTIDLARAYEFGLGVARDNNRSEDLWKEAINAGTAESYLGYADFLHNTTGKQATEVEIRVLLEQAASTGDLQSTWLAYDAAQNAGDTKMAAEWFSQLEALSAKGNVLAISKVADVYRIGKDGKTDDLKAYGLYRQAAQAGDSYAKAWVGKLVLENPSLDPGIDAQIAEGLVKAAAAQGEPIAYVTLAQRTLKAGDYRAAFELAAIGAELATNNKQAATAKEILFNICNEQVDAECAPVPVFYFTNRKKVVRENLVAYENRIDPDHTPSFGLAHVTISTSADVSSERKSFAQWVWEKVRPSIGREENPQRPDPSDSSVTNEEISGSAADFLKAVKIAGEQNGRTKVLIFIHGFNNSFDDAVRRLALFSEQFKYPGIPVVLSWGSAANSIVSFSDGSGYSGVGYKNDEQSVSQSCREFRVILETIVDEFGKDNVMVIGHSMGGRLLYYVLTGCPALPGAWKEERVIDNLILAAPDIDEFEFKQSIEQARKLANSFTIYVSANDVALRTSQAIVGGRSRVGQGGKDRVLVAGIDTIDASTVEDLPSSDDQINHAYVFEVPQVKRDLAELLKGTRKPDDRVCPAKYEDPASKLPYWLMQPDCAD